MSATSDATSLAGLEGLVGQFIGCTRQRFSDLGSVSTNAYSCTVGSTKVSIGSHVGGKATNEDYVAYFEPAADGSMRWAAAIADGVSGSVLGGVAAELACKLALSTLARNHVQRSKRGAAYPILFANRVLRRIGFLIAKDPDRFCPHGVPASIWKRAVASGKFLQTTLTLVWEEDQQVQIVNVGDGGIVYSVVSDPNAFAVHSLGEGPLDCIGPQNTPRDIQAYRIENCHGLACYTDGLDDVMEQVEGAAELLLGDGSGTVADVLELIDSRHPEFVEDNLSVIRFVRSGA